MSNTAQYQEIFGHVKRLRGEIGTTIDPNLPLQESLTEARWGEVSGWLDWLESEALVGTKMRVGTAIDQTFGRVQELEVDSPWRTDEFDSIYNAFDGLAAGLPDLTSHDHLFRALETTALVSVGYRMSEAAELVAVLPTMKKAKRMAKAVPTGYFGSGLLRALGDVRDSLSSGIALAGTAVDGLSRLWRLLRLSAVIEADGRAADVLGELMQAATSNLVCRTSQFLADLQGAYEAAHP